MNEGNLKPFLKGISGNPKGRPKGSKSITAVLRKMMNKNIRYSCMLSKVVRNVSLAEHVAMRLIALALEGDIRAIREILDRVDGRSTVSTSEVVEHDPFGHLTKEQIDDIIRIRDGD